MIYSLDNTDLTGCAYGEKLYMRDCPHYSEASLTAYHAFTLKMTNPRDEAGVREVFSARSAVPDSGRLVERGRQPEVVQDAVKHLPFDLYTHITTRQDGGSNQGPQCEDSLKPLHRLPLLDP